MGVATGYLACLHIQIALSGLAVIGIAIYVIVEGQDYLPNTQGAYSWTVYVPLAFGIVIFCIAMCACFCESVYKSKIFIVFFSLLQLVFGVVIIAAGVALLILSNQYIPTIAASEFPTQEVPPGVGGLQKETSDFLLGLYAGCCSLSNPFSQCPTGTPIGSKQYCFANTDIFEAGVTAGAESVNSYCVIQPLNQTCPTAANGNFVDIDGFLNGNADLMRTFVFPASIALTVFGCLLAIAFFCSCSLLCRSEPAPPPAKQQTERTAQETAYGGKPTGNKQDINYA